MNNFSFKPVNKHTFTNKSIINVVPCVIDYQGKASVNDYFNKKTLKNEENQEFSNNFRGRALLGKEIDLENSGNVAGVVYEKKFVNKCDYEYVPIEIFNKFRYWKYDEKQEYDDQKFNEIVAFMEISDLVNKEISE